MTDFFDEAEYLTLPEHSPYLDTSRFEHPKEIFKHVVRRLHAITDPGRSYTYADVACANGEFLYYLKQEFPHWQFAGFDYEPAFIDVARRVAALSDVRFEVKDLFDIDESFDFVSFLGIMSTFWEPEQPLEKLLSITNDGGSVFVDGYFNEYEVEVRVVYCDYSTEGGKDRWRRDWSQHRQSRLRAFLAGRARDVSFEPVEMSVDLPRDESAPHINAWTFKDADGRNIITNGTHMMLNDVMMVVHK